jgi:hypothetical protein
MRRMLRSVRKGGAIPTGLPLWLVGLALVTGALVALIAARPATSPAGTATVTIVGPPGHHRHHHRDWIRVHPGESIQRAVNHAHSGDTILVMRGVYHETVEIKKDNLTLRGKGPSGDGTVLKPSGSSSRCHDGTSGICVLPHRKHGERKSTKSTSVRSFIVKGFEGSGFLAKGARGATITHDAFVNNGEYGAAAFSSHSTAFFSNRAKGAGEAGFYVGDSRRANALLFGNRARHNGEFGFFIRDSSEGQAFGNKSDHNCTGIGLVNTGAPGKVQSWSLDGNYVFRNNAQCEGEDGGPPLSGTGIALLGAKDNVLKYNAVLSHHPRGASAFPGGIVLASSKTFGGSDAAGNTVTRNYALGNRPKDIFWDGEGADNEFDRNKCDHSEPSGLC